MKGLVHVMIIDDMEKRTIDGLVALDFKRKFLSFMSTSELSKKIQEFRNAHAEDEFAKANPDYIVYAPTKQGDEIATYTGRHKLYSAFIKKRIFSYIPISGLHVHEAFIV